jgi:GNAT superfamily N-acetyltransferase
MSQIAIRRLSSNQVTDQEILHGRLFDFMNSLLGKYYPGFEIWYEGKVIPQFEEQKRVVWIAMSGNSLVGVSIVRVGEGKCDKVCSFFVHPELRGNGVGHELLRLSLLEATARGRRVVATVPEERLCEQSGRTPFWVFLRDYGLTVTMKVPGLYRSNRDEMLLVGDPHEIRGRLKKRESYSLSGSPRENADEPRVLIAEHDEFDHETEETRAYGGLKCQAAIR